MNPGDVVGKLTLISRHIGKTSGLVVWQAQCACRRLCTVRESELTGELAKPQPACAVCSAGGLKGYKAERGGITAKNERLSPVASEREKQATASALVTPGAVFGLLTVVSEQDGSGRVQVQCGCGEVFVTKATALTHKYRPILRCATCAGNRVQVRRRVPHPPRPCVKPKKRVSVHPGDVFGELEVIQGADNEGRVVVFCRACRQESRLHPDYFTRRYAPMRVCDSCTRAESTAKSE